LIPRLVYITDGARGTAGRPLAEVAAAAFDGGIDALLVRERGLPGAELARTIDALSGLRARGLRVLVSRRLDVARALALDGVHLAADAVPVAEARSWLGPDPWLGYSAHSAEEAKTVAASGANYVTLSPVYPTDSKPGARGRGVEWLRESLVGLSIPALALGGVTPERTHEILKAGAWGVAAISAIGAAPDVARAAGEFRTAILETRV